MALMGYREYARHRACTLRAVQKAIEAGRIKLVDDNGKSWIDSEQADRDWTDNTDPAKQSLMFSAGPATVGNPAPRAEAGKAPGAGGALRAPPASSEEAEAEQSIEDTAAYRRERAERERIRRQKEEIELEQLRGKLVDRAEVARLRFTEFRELRDSIGNLAPRIAPLVAIETDPVKCEQLYMDALEEILKTFADKVLTRDVLQDEEEDDDDADNEAD
jgi:hypothetical protein